MQLIKGRADLDPRILYKIFDPGFRYKYLDWIKVWTGLDRVGQKCPDKSGLSRPQRGGLGGDSPDVLPQRPQGRKVREKERKRKRGEG